MQSIRTKDDQEIKIPVTIFNDLHFKESMLFSSFVWEKVISFMKYYNGLTKKSKDKLHNLTFLDTNNSMLTWYNKYTEMSLEELCHVIKASEELRLKNLNLICCKAMMKFYNTS